MHQGKLKKKHGKWIIIWSSFPNGTSCTIGGSCSEKKGSVTYTMNMSFGERPSGNQTPYLNPACLCQAPHRMNKFNENICTEIRIIPHHIEIANFCNFMLNKLRRLYSLYGAQEAFKPPEAPDRSTASFIQGWQQWRRQGDKPMGVTNCQERAHLRDKMFGNYRFNPREWVNSKAEAFS